MCLVRYVRFIDNNVNDNLWIIDRHCSDKGNQILSSCTCTGRIVDLLGCTGLSSDPVTWYLRLCTGTFLYGQFQITSDQLGNIRRDRLL